MAGQQRQQQPLQLDERRPRLAERLGHLFVVAKQGQQADHDADGHPMSTTKQRAEV
jgi:hypothetical protein